MMFSKTFNITIAAFENKAPEEEEGAHCNLGNYRGQEPS
jgi:hypothetical protein